MFHGAINLNGMNLQISLSILWVDFRFTDIGIIVTITNIVKVLLFVTNDIIELSSISE